MPGKAPCTYVMPIRWGGGELRASVADYLKWVVEACDEVIVVDGSEDAVNDANARAWPRGVVHMRPAEASTSLNGKVDGVMTGVRAARNEAVVIADDDVRYEDESLGLVLRHLADADLVRPQNHFTALPWHARLDTARTLLNRAMGGDFPGTFGLRRSTLLAVGGYDGDVLFENLELMRTVRAAGGRVVTPLDLFVGRLPPTTSHFRGQRVRQAYDDFALPIRMAVWLATIPVLVAAVVARRGEVPLVLGCLSVAVAEAGRRRAGGAAKFPATSSLLAPAWVLERAVCAWLALAARLGRGGVRYAGSTIRRSAHSQRRLRRRLQPFLRSVSRDGCTRFGSPGIFG